MDPEVADKLTMKAMTAGSKLSVVVEDISSSGFYKTWLKSASTCTIMNNDDTNDITEQVDKPEHDSKDVITNLLESVLNTVTNDPIADNGFSTTTTKTSNDNDDEVSINAKPSRSH